jgi:hypothetical protein
MVKQIDEAYDTDNFFSTFLSGGALQAMHSYTHSGLRQLSRRFTGRSVEPNYGEEEIVEAINVTTIAICLMARILLMTVGKQKEADQAQGDHGCLRLSASGADFRRPFGARLGEEIHTQGSACGFTLG